MKNKRNKLPLIGAICIVLGLLIAVPAFIMGAATGFARTPNGFQLTGARYRQRVGLSDGQLVTKNENSLPDFNHVYIDVSYADIQFEEASQAGLQLTYIDTQEISWKVENDTLRITQPYRENGNFQINFFNLDPIWNLGTSPTPQSPSVTMYLPKGITLGNVEIKGDTGACSIGNFTASTLLVTNSYGSLQLQNIKTDTLTLKCDTNDIRMDATTAKEAHITNSYGNVVIQNSQLEKATLNTETADIRIIAFEGNTLQLTNTYGKITVENATADSLAISGQTSGVSMLNCTFQNADIRTSYGAVDAQNLTTHGLTIKGDTTSVKIQGAFYGTTDISTSYGGVRVETTVARAQYNWQMEVSYGSIYLDGDDTGEKSTFENGAENNLKISAQTGDVHVEWQK